MSPENSAVTSHFLIDDSGWTLEHYSLIDIDGGDNQNEYCVDTAYSKDNVFMVS